MLFRSDVFSKEIGTKPSKELYKFFDKEGNTLVLRPDFTPSIARCASKYFNNEVLPLRFSYIGNTFTNTSNLRGKLKEVTQIGAELIGDSTVEADAEMVSLVIEALQNTGLQEFQISIGQVDFFKGICEEAGIDAETEYSLKEYISNKNYFGVEELLTSKKIDDKFKAILLKLTDLFGSIDSLKEAKELVHNERSIKAIERLEEVYEIICLYGKEKYVSFDLGMLSKYNYYSGIIFKAYTFGVGDAIVAGGRYDNLLKQFGKSSSAIGFMIVIDDLLDAFHRQKLQIELTQKKAFILYNQENYKAALAFAMTMRKTTTAMEMLVYDSSISNEEYLALAKTRLANKIYILLDSTIQEMEVL